jgi:hypothetical protein
MTLTAHTQDLLSRLQGMLALSDDEIVQRGIAQATTDRIIELRQRAAQLKERHLSLKKLEAQVAQGVTAGDHSLYTDLLEWRAVRHELEQLTRFLEAA